MDIVTTVLGLFLVLASATFLAVRHAKRGPNVSLPKGELLIGFSIGILGVLLIVSPRITSLPTPFGAVHTAAQQALADAGDIARLKTQAQTQTATINLVADQAAKAKVLSEAVAGQITDAQGKLANLNTALTTAQAALDKAKQEEDFIMTVLAAQDGDDRTSFDKLKAIANDSSNPFSKMAAQAWLSVLRSHSSGLYESGFTIPWKSGLDPSKLDMNQLTSSYYATPILQPAILEYISKRNDIPKNARLAFFISVISSDKSLRAMEYAGLDFIALSGKTNISNPMNSDGLLLWWKDHQNDPDMQ